MHDVNDMLFFAHVVKVRSFSEAARRLDVSKSRVSKAIARLESSLGVRLLHRSTRSLSLTDVGEAYFEHCDRILEEVGQADTTISRLHQEPRGKLKISAPVAFSTMHVASALPDFMALYPDLTVDLTISDRLVDLAEDAYDLAIRLTAQPPDTLAARPLRPLRRVLCAAPDYLERHGTPRRPDDLARHNCLVYPQGESLGNWAFEIEGRSVQMPVRGTVRSNSTETLLQLARQGVGIVAMRDYTVTPDLAAGRLVEVLRAFAPASTAQLYALYLPNRHLPPKARVFIDFLAEQFATSAG